MTPTITTAEMESRLLQNPINTFVCGSIRRLRIEQGLRVKDLARRAGIPIGSYSCLETGRYRFNMESLFRILHALGKDIADVWPVGKPPVPQIGTVTNDYMVRWARLAEKKRPSLKPSIGDILMAVSHVFEVDEKDLAKPSRDRRHTEARSVAALITRRYSHLTLIDLARLFRRDPSSLSHGIARIENRLEDEEDLREKIEEVHDFLEELFRY